MSVLGEAPKGLARDRHVLDGDGEVILKFGAPTDVERAHSRGRGRISSQPNGHSICTEKEQG